MTTYALNGLGRMGKLALRPLLERGAEIVFVNDAVGDPAMHAHLLEFDTVHGRWPATFAADDQSITIDGIRIPCRQGREIADLPLEGVDVVIDCTGVFKSAATLQPYFDAGVKKVVVSAPVKDGNAANIVMGVNHDRYDPAGHRIVTAASCTTNCLAPVVKVIHENLGITLHQGLPELLRLNDTNIAIVTILLLKLCDILTWLHDNGGKFLVFETLDKLTVSPWVILRLTLRCDFDRGGRKIICDTEHRLITMTSPF